MVNVRLSPGSIKSWEQVYDTVKTLYGDATLQHVDDEDGFAMAIIDPGKEQFVEIAEMTARKINEN
jgi:hypothetical protein